MKKKEDNRQSYNIDFLEQKYKHEKEILLKDNNKLQQQLNQEIDRNNTLTLKYEKLQQTAQIDNDQLRRQNQQLNARILQLEKYDESQCESQQQQLQNLLIQKQLVIENQNLQKDKLELCDLLQKMQNEKNELDQKYISNESQLKQELQILEQKHSQFKRQSSRQMQQLSEAYQQLQQDYDKLNQKFIDHKSKRKQTQKKLQQLQKRLRESEELEQQREYQKTQNLRQERDRLHEKNIQLNTKLTLLQANLHQKDQFISSIQLNHQEGQRKIALERQQLQQYRNKIQQLQNECYRLGEQCVRLDKEKNLQTEKVTRSIDQTIKEMRKKMREELVALIQNNDQQLSQKNLQRFMEGVTIRQSLGQADTVIIQQQQKPLSVVKLQSQINTLEAQIIQYRKQQERVSFQYNKMRKQLEQKQYQLQRRDHQLRDQRNKIERLDAQRNRELLALRNQNQSLKNVETQKLQMAKQHQQYQTAMSLKLAFYQRKIKEHLDTIDRKESIIEKLKIFRAEAEQKQKNYDQNIRKLTEQVDMLKRFKQDCSRKEELIRDYKSKIQKFKVDLQQTKEELALCKKDKQRIEKQLESKEQYLATIKNRQEKPPIEHNDQNSRLKQLKQLKNSYESKLKHLRRDKADAHAALEQIKKAVLDKVEQFVARSIPVGKRKAQPYEAAKLLGLKAAELQEFLNPGSSANRKITQQLESLWEENNFSQFVRSYSDYLLAQQPVRNDLLI